MVPCSKCISFVWFAGNLVMDDSDCRRHIAPEVQAALQAGISPLAASTAAGDIWSLGSILWTMAAALPPITDHTLFGTALQPCALQQSDHPMGKERLVIKAEGSHLQAMQTCLEECISAECAALIRSLLCSNPAKRPTAAAALAVPYFDDMRPEDHQEGLQPAVGLQEDLQASARTSGECSLATSHRSAASSIKSSSLFLRARQHLEQDGQGAGEARDAPGLDSRIGAISIPPFLELRPDTPSDLQHRV